MKKAIALSAIAFLATTAFADAGMQAKLDALMMKMELMEKSQQAKIDALTAKIAEMEKGKTATLQTQLATTPAQDSEIEVLKEKIAKVEEKQETDSKRISEVNVLAAKDNIKFDVDFRTAYDNLQYKMADGTKQKNDALYSNRLWLGMGYAPTDELIFKGQISFNKAFGASWQQRAQGGAFDSFDWVVNENLTDDTLKLREAYWLWTPTIGDRGYTVSVGRRPATNGFLANLRDDDEAKSPMGHVINMEFDGASASVKLDDVLPGMYAKLCLGRGLTNAQAWANANGVNYADSSSDLDNTDMVGVIVKPYDDGQYSVMTKYYRGFSVPGIKSGSLATLGDMDGAAISAKMDGIGEEISDFLDETTLFASFAWSETRPNSGEAMLGSTDRKSGTSFWLGAQMPNMTGGRFGLEYNHGSKYWKPFTYGEDTMIGSKMAARGDAYEAYWTQPLIDNIFTMQIRYTYIDYKYSGSNGFFGENGAPWTMAEAIGGGNGDKVTDVAQDLRVYFRYRY